MNSSKLKGYLTGLILGDGYIDKGVTKRALSIKSINFDFIKKLEDDLEFTNFKIKVKEFPASCRGGVNSKAYKELRVQAHPYFNKIFHKFYTDTRKRRILKSCLDDLNPEGLANWYMSDGYIVLVGKTKGAIRDRRVELCLDRYTPEDVDKVIDYFQDTYGYKLTKVKRKEGVYRIRFNRASAQDFFLMIRDHVTPSMMYKLDMKYDYQPKWMSDEYFNLMNKIGKRVAPNSLEKGDDIVHTG